MRSIPRPRHRLDSVPTLAGAGHAEVKRYLALRAGRTGSKGRVGLDGLWSLRRARESAVPLEVAFRCPELSRGPEGAALVAQLEAEGVRCYEVSPRLAERMADRDGPDGMFAIARLKDWNLDDLPTANPALLMVLDRLENAGNTGTMIRLADAVGAGVIACDSRVRLEHPTVLHASMATVLHVPLARATGDETRGWLRANGFQVVLADPECPIGYRGAPYRAKVAVVVGSERYGLTGGWPAAADLAVSLPMRGRADSLNVGQAAAVILYEVLDSHSP